MIWLRKVNIKQFLTSGGGDREAKRVAQLMAAYIAKRLPEYALCDQFRMAETQDSLNDALEHLYDWADEHRVWLGLRSNP